MGRDGEQVGGGQEWKNWFVVHLLIFTKRNRRNEKVMSVTQIFFFINIKCA